MWLSIFHRLMEIVYEKGSTFIGRELIKSLIEMEYRITAKPITSKNLTSSAALE